MWFLEGELDKDWPCSYVSPIGMENKWSRSSKWKKVLKKMKGFVNSNCFREVLYVVKSSYQASPKPKKIIKKYKKTNDYQVSTRLDMIINVYEK